MPNDFRPDIIGGVEGFEDDGTFVMAMYFTSEAEAREGEQKPLPADMQTMMEEGQANTTEMTFIDLTNRPSTLRADEERRGSSPAPPTRTRRSGRLGAVVARRCPSRDARALWTKRNVDDFGSGRESCRR